jgi:hypothetical protein
VRAADLTDEAFILALNDASQPAVGPLSQTDMIAFRRAGAAIRVAHVAQAGPVGFAILLTPGTAYGSDNYAWFEQRFGRHLYIDRIAVAAAARRRGVASALYADAEAACRASGLERLTAEVNVDPPNPESLEFHAARGFVRLCERPSRSGKRVVMLERPLGCGP